MSFREKSAWVTLLALLTVTIAFLLHVPRPWTLAPEPGGFLFHVLAVAVIAFVVVEIVAHIVIAVLAPRDVNAPKDERERLIDLKATRVSAFVFSLLALCSVATVHFGANQIGLAYLVTLSFVVGEIVNYAARIVYYRRGV